MPSPSAPAPGPLQRADQDAQPADASAGAQRIQAVDRAVALLKSVAASATPPTVLELARECGINRSTAWRLLRTLEHHGFVDRDPITQRYTVGYGAVSEVDPPRAVVPSWLGKPLPLHATSGGKAFLAWLRPDERDAILPAELPRYTARTITDRDLLERELAEVRRVGYALCNREYEEFSAGASAVVLTTMRYPMAVINAWGPAPRNPARKLREIGIQAAQIAGEIRALLD